MFLYKVENIWLHLFPLVYWQFWLDILLNPKLKFLSCNWNYLFSIHFHVELFYVKFDGGMFWVQQ